MTNTGATDLFVNYDLFIQASASVSSDFLYDASAYAYSEGFVGDYAQDGTLLSFSDVNSFVMTGKGK